MPEIAYYSSDYWTARSRFRELAEQKGGQLYALPVNKSRGLFIDVARWRGTTNTLILHSSGVHGVEAYPGSAVQCAFLEDFEPTELSGHSLAMIHCINPFGMQYLRRWNAENVDLNRNFLEDFDHLPDNPLYQYIHSFLNPRQVTQLMGFGIRAIRLLMKYRFSTLQQAIAQGQYQNPEGLFFGGLRPAKETDVVLHFIADHLREYTHIRGIDFHTGLGKYGHSTFYLEADFTAEDRKEIERLLHAPVIQAQARAKRSYQLRGGFIARLRQLYQDQDFLMVTQEIGTVSPLKILKALREENFCYHHAPDQQPEAGIQVKHVFCPEDEGWKRRAVREGVKALHRLFHPICIDSQG